MDSRTAGGDGFAFGEVEVFRFCLQDIVDGYRDASCSGCKRIRPAIHNAAETGNTPGWVPTARSLDAPKRSVSGSTSILKHSLQVITTRNATFDFPCNLIKDFNRHPLEY